jgi:hypothetical protein
MAPSVAEDGVWARPQLTILSIETARLGVVVIGCQALFSLTSVGHQEDNSRRCDILGLLHHEAQVRSTRDANTDVMPHVAGLEQQEGP